MVLTVRVRNRAYSYFDEQPPTVPWAIEKVWQRFVNHRSSASNW